MKKDNTGWVLGWVLLGILVLAIMGLFRPEYLDSSDSSEPSSSKWPLTVELHAASFDGTRWGGVAFNLNKFDCRTASVTVVAYDEWGRELARKYGDTGKLLKGAEWRFWVTVPQSTYKVKAVDSRCTP